MKCNKEDDHDHHLITLKWIRFQTELFLGIYRKFIKTGLFKNASAFNLTVAQLKVKG